MAEQKLVKSIYNVDDVSALGEFAATDTFPVANAPAELARLGTAQSWTAEQTFKETKDTVFAITAGASITIDPANGNVQTVTLNTLDTTLVLSSFVEGQCVLLGTDDGSARTYNWDSQVTWVKAGGTASAPTLATTGYTWILLWKVGTTMYGAEVGKP